MAGNFNKVILLGNLTRDIELRHTTGNNAVANVGLAVNRRWKTPEGEQREEVTFVDCEAWGRTAEVMAQYLNKGRPVFIEGRLKLDTWQDKESGQNRSKLKVVVESFQFVDSRGEGGGGGANPGAPRAARPTPAKSASDEWGGKGPMGEEDIPF
ncbi:MAG: single-stranded DNA-binding protein [Phycisphaerales bacterium]